VDKGGVLLVNHERVCFRRVEFDHGCCRFGARQHKDAEMGYAATRRHANPIDIVEQIANGHDWACERNGDDELTLIVAGDWTDYHVSLNWRDDIEALHLACAFDFKVPETRLTEMYRLVAQINEQLWLGHFDLWTADGLIMFRHALLLNGSVATPAQCEAMLKAALEGCERYYQAFQFVVWAGRESREALATAMFETEGRAQ
jgi:hypothetical protein